MGRNDDLMLPQDTPFLSDTGVKRLCAILQAGGYRAYVVGGAVRNAILCAGPSDTDLATDARPGQVMGLCQAAGLKAIPTGVDHGTVTVIVDSGPVEVTTFRRDIATDGRRAIVAFSDDIREDAQRRDFTMNALYARLDARLDGRVVDPLGEGLRDTLARRVRFIGDPRARIREDYLRILRFFRFSAFYGDPAHGFEAEPLAAIADHLDGLSHVSSERVGAEVIKLLGAPDPAPAIACMVQTNVLARILPDASATALAPLVAVEKALEIPPEPIRRLAVMAGGNDVAHLRLSRRAARDLNALREAVETTHSPQALGFLLGPALGLSAALARAAMLQQVPPDLRAASLVAKGAAAAFPIRAADLAGRYEGAGLGAELSRLRARWLASDLTLDRDALLRDHD